MGIYALIRNDQVENVIVAEPEILDLPEFKAMGTFVDVTDHPARPGPGDRVVSIDPVKPEISVFERAPVYPDL